MATVVAVAVRKVAGGRQQYRDKRTFSNPLSFPGEAESYRISKHVLNIRQMEYVITFSYNKNYSVNIFS